MPLNKPIEKRYFTITEVAEELGLNASQLRYWEKEFSQLNPRTNARGKRLYTADDKLIIEQIAWLVKEQKFTIDGARKAMKKRKEVAASMEAVQMEAAPNQAAVLARLKPVREKLVDLESKLS